MTDAAAARELERQAVPTRCSVLADNGIVTFHCTAVPQVELQAEERTAELRREKGPLGARGRQALQRSGSHAVRLVGRGESLVLGADEFERFQRDFIFANGFMAAGGPPVRAAAGGDSPGWVVEYTPMPLGIRVTPAP
jgi:hypothetical protein